MGGGDTVQAQSELLTQWRADLAAWAIPEYITAAVPDSPWVLPRHVFARRADRLRQAPAGPSFQLAWDGAGPAGQRAGRGRRGRGRLPAAGAAHHRADRGGRRPGHAGPAGRAGPGGRAWTPRLCVGGWPEVAAQTAPADVVTCHNVLYNVPDLGPFIEALTGRARRRVVVELTAAHPLTSLNPLWLRFHGLQRPKGPTAGDVLAILDAMGLRAGHTEWNRPAEADYATVRELAEVTRRRLCLPAERAAEVEAALRETGLSGGQAADLGTAGRAVVTIWWEGSA